MIPPLAPIAAAVTIGNPALVALLLADRPLTDDERAYVTACEAQGDDE